MDAGSAETLASAPATVPSNDAFIVSVPGVFEVSVLVATPLVSVVTVSLPLKMPAHSKSTAAPETGVHVVPLVVCSRVAVKV